MASLQCSFFNSLGKSSTDISKVCFWDTERLLGLVDTVRPDTLETDHVTRKVARVTFHP